MIRFGDVFTVHLHSLTSLGAGHKNILIRSLKMPHTLLVR